MKILSKIEKLQPQAAFTSFILGLKHKANYIMRTIPNVEEHLKILDQVIDTDFIPAISNGICINSIVGSKETLFLSPWYNPWLCVSEMKT